MLVILKGKELQNALSWHNTHTQFHINRLRHSSDTKVITSKISEAIQCWYWCWEGFIKYAVEMTSDGMIYIPSFIMIGCYYTKDLRCLVLV
jgi:hypothetical protein